ncbi:kelch-like protein 5 [Phlebotomus argentipes]|uniref:kelch-like protein 5 n=1 Tax=Phlebotomus argentipes TaxID=94469 RepID=UPI002892ADE4|nr:kelch-like protein 5 [Phlebotomus argentipes]
MQNYQENKTPYDVVLIAGLDEQRIPAHRGVLSAASEVFAAMLLGNFQEAGEEEVTLGEISGADLQFLVQFCYTGKVQLSESSVDSVKTLLSAADCFQLDDLVRYCDTFLTRHLNHSNCLGIAEIAELHNCDGLAITSSYYISQHFLKVCENQEFVEISAEQLAKLLACDDLNVSSEEDVFNALLVWLKGEFKHRKKFIPTLLGLIRLHRLNPEFIISKVKPLCESVNCKDLVSQALEWHRWPNRSAMRLSQKPRRWNAGRLITVGYDCAGGEKRYVVDAYCFRTKKWTFVAENNENHFNCGIAFNGNGIMFMGGSCGTQHRNNVNCLNLATKDLRMLPPMRSDRAEFCSAELNGFVYAIGGRNMNSVERFGKGIWTEEPPMSTRRYEAGAVVFQGDLVVIGGRNGDNYHNSVERYDPWTRKKI